MIVKRLKANFATLSENNGLPLTNTQANDNTAATNIRHKYIGVRITNSI